MSWWGGDDECYSERDFDALVSEALEAEPVAREVGATEALYDRIITSRMEADIVRSEALEGALHSGEVHSSYATYSTIKMAWLIAGVVRCHPCPHLATDPFQAAHVSLNQRAALCITCMGSGLGLEIPSAVPDEQCDCCDNQHCESFTSIIVQLNAYLVEGSFCHECIEVLDPQ